ncbi:MAG: hypothetical protein NZU63_05845 [Gemmataceae bacterium]|nr:hypothetical protein [Gemmataceae bacterium]
MVQPDPSSSPQFLTVQEVPRCYASPLGCCIAWYRSDRARPGLRVNPDKRLRHRTTVEQFLASGGRPPPTRRK